MAILVLALAVRADWCFYTAHRPRIGDPTSYYFYGISIARGQGYNSFLFDLREVALHGTQSTRHIPTALFPPGYPAVLGGLFWVVLRTPFSDNFVAASAILNVILSTVTVLMAFEVARRLFDTRVALVAAALLAVYPNLVFHTATMHWETTFNFLAMAAILVLVRRPWKRGRVPTRTLLLFALVLGCSVLVRPISLPLVGALLVATLVAGAGARRVLVQCGIVFAIVAALVLPWTIRNMIKMHSPVVVSTGTGIALCQSRNPHPSPVLDFDVLHRYCEPADLAEIPIEKQEVEINSFATSQAFESVVHHPMREVGQWWPRATHAFTQDHDALVDATDFAPRGLLRTFTWIADWYFFGVAGLALVGIYAVVRRPSSSPQGLFLVLATLSFAATPLLLFGDPRYKVPATPLLTILAAAGAVGIADRLRQRGSVPDATSTPVRG